MALLIGVTLDSEQPGGYSRYPWYALRQNYCEAISKAGAAPLCLPHDVAAVKTYLATCAGIVVTGGGFDVDPQLYGQSTMHETVLLKPNRTIFELALIKGALERSMPILGICGGEQILAVALGGTLLQHIPDDVPAALEHSPDGAIHDPSGTAAAHQIEITAGSLLHHITGVRQMGVNSSHHQAVKTAGSVLQISATAPDGVIEAIEHPSHPFCLGVQWHPEYYRCAEDQRIFAAFVEACGNRARAA